MATRRQIEANKENSKKSTGPKSAAGKEVVSGNATRHGILSSRLLLNDEDPAQFQQLFDELMETYKPQGVLETVLVEKIAVAIWKQRRVIAAETASITLSCQDTAVFKSINSSLGKYQQSDKVTAEDLKPANQNLVTWSETILQEWKFLLQAKANLSMDELEVNTPQYMNTLKKEALRVSNTIEEYLLKKGTDLPNWFRDTMIYAEKALLKARQHTQVVELYNAANAELSILPDKPRASYERYQATLDNQLYRAMRELRQLQEHRLKQLEVVVHRKKGSAEAEEAVLS